MVQEFHVLRCFSCQSFQVQQVKKVNRWSCKLCGEKQSLLKEFGRGSAADCRRHVQKLNARRGAMMEEQEHDSLSLWKQVEADGEEEPQEPRNDQVTQTQVSCWSKYLDSPEEAEPQEKEEENVLMDVQQHFGNKMIDRKRKRSEGRTDSRGQESCTPGQTHLFNLKTTPGRDPDTTSLNQTSLNQTSLNHTSLNHTSLNHTSLNQTSLKTSSPSLSSGSASRWARFVSSDCPANEGEEETLVSGRSQTVGGVLHTSGHDIISQTPPLTKPRPLLPVSSMFQSGDEFNFDDEFLTAD